MSIFSGIQEATVTGGGRYIVPGQYDLEVMEVKKFESVQTKGRWFFCAEFLVTDYQAPNGHEAKYREGDQVSWLVDMSQPSALSNIKGFAMALSAEAAESDIDAESMEALVGSDQPAAGIKIRASAFHKKTRKGTDFTMINWSADQS